MDCYYTYIMASKPNGRLYVGLTSDLIKRVCQHRNIPDEGVACRDAVHDLVYFEKFGDVNTAIRREKRLKRWQRRSKVALIEIDNPCWRDLYPGIAGLTEYADQGRQEKPADWIP